MAQQLFPKFFKVEWSDDYREGTCIHVWPEEGEEDNSNSDDESGESSDCWYTICLEYMAERYRVYLVVLSVDGTHVQILRSYAKRESVEKFAEKQFRAMHDGVAPFWANGKSNSAGHPRGGRIARYKRGKLAWNKDLIEDDENAALVVIDDRGSITTTYSLDYDSVW